MTPGMKPVCITHAGRSFYVLPLSPMMPADFRSGRDLIIPSAEAFCNPVTTSVMEFPLFTTRNCSWSSIFEMVKQPRFLWASWHPGNIGEYRSIKELWAAWHEGTIIDGIGQMPPLQLVEEEWGGTKDRMTNAGRRQTWRPHNDNNVSTAPPCTMEPESEYFSLLAPLQVRRRWSQLMFFVSRIKSAMAAGKHASQAVHDLDDQRGSMSVPQFHSSLQQKRKRPHASATSSASMSGRAAVHV
jgi:hypothetical protein